MTSTIQDQGNFLSVVAEYLPNFVVQMLTTRLEPQYDQKKNAGFMSDANIYDEMSNSCIIAKAYLGHTSRSE